MLRIWNWIEIKFLHVIVLQVIMRRLTKSDFEYDVTRSTWWLWRHFTVFLPLAVAYCNSLLTAECVWRQIVHLYLFLSHRTLTAVSIIIIFKENYCRSCAIFVIALFTSSNHFNSSLWLSYFGASMLLVWYCCLSVCLCLCLRHCALWLNDTSYSKSVWISE